MPSLKVFHVEIGLAITLRRLENILVKIRTNENELHVVDNTRPDELSTDDSTWLNSILLHGFDQHVFAKVIVTILSVDINRSESRCAAEAGAVRLGFMYVRELGTKAIARILSERQRARFTSLADFYYRTSIETAAIENLAMVGAFDAFGLTRRQSLWQLGLLEKTGPEQLLLGLTDADVSLPTLTEMEAMRAEYQTQGLSAKHHPMQVLRQVHPEIMTLTSAEVSQLAEGAAVRFAGYVATRQRPGTAKGFCFLTLEDDSGMVNVVIRPDIYEQHRQIFRLAPVIVVEGMIQKRDGITNVIAQRLSPFK